MPFFLSFHSAQRRDELRPAITGYTRSRVVSPIPTSSTDYHAGPSQVVCSIPLFGYLSCGDIKPAGRSRLSAVRGRWPYVIIASRLAPPFQVEHSVVDCGKAIMPSSMKPNAGMSCGQQPLRSYQSERPAAVTSAIHLN